MSGNYTTTQADRVTGAPRGTALRFMKELKRPGGPWPGRNQMVRGRYHLSFPDLMELRKIAEMLNEGCTFREIRARASETGGEYPFSTGGDRAGGNRKAMAEDPSVTMAEGRPVRWTPGTQWEHAEIGDRVMLDPSYNWGAPSTRESCLRTELLLDRYHAEGNDPEAVAQDYRIDPRDVRAAVAFEQVLAGGTIPRPRNNSEPARTTKQAGPNQPTGETWTN